MKLFFSTLIFTVLLFGSISVILAQTSSGTGVVINNKQTNSQTKKNTVSISQTDFNNFTFPVPNLGKLQNSITLKNGISVGKAGSPNFTLRKTYYFDLTGDNEDEAITHIISDGCEIGCESSSLFYVHTIENDKPKLLWKIALAGDVLGGLKTAHFMVKEFVIETFGECTIDDWIIRTNLDMKKTPKASTANYSRFVFTYENGSFTSGVKTILPVEANLNMASFRPKISFGEQ